MKYEVGDEVQVINIFKGDDKRVMGLKGIITKIDGKEEIAWIKFPHLKFDKYDDYYEEGLGYQVYFEHIEKIGKDSILAQTTDIQIIEGYRYKLKDLDGTEKIIEYIGECTYGEIKEFINIKTNEKFTVPTKFIHQMNLTEVDF